MPRRFQSVIVPIGYGLGYDLRISGAPFRDLAEMVRLELEKANRKNSVGKYDEDVLDGLWSYSTRNKKCTNNCL